jgi:hypothetical protein
MSRQARYDWRHGITKAKTIRINDHPASDDHFHSNNNNNTNNNIVVRDEKFRRLSLTIRRLLDTRKQAGDDDRCWREYTNRWSNETECLCDQQQRNTEE